MCGVQRVVADHRTNSRCRTVKIGSHGYTDRMGGPELYIVLAIVVLLFGGSQIPKLAKSLGQAQKEFKSGLKEGKEGDPEEEPKTS